MICISAFKLIEGYQGPLQKIVYLIGNVICLALAVYKCQVMGLLPTQPSDWLAFVEPQKVSWDFVLLFFHRDNTS